MKAGYTPFDWPNVPKGRRPLNSCPKHGAHWVGPITKVCFQCHLGSLVASGAMTEDEAAHRLSTARIRHAD